MRFFKKVGNAISAPTRAIAKVLPQPIRKGFRYYGAVVQTAFAPVLPAKTQASIFGLSSGESARFERGQKVSRIVWGTAATYVGGSVAYGSIMGKKFAAAAAAGKLGAAPAGSSLALGGASYPGAALGSKLNLAGASQTGGSFAFAPGAASTFGSTIGTGKTLAAASKSAGFWDLTASGLLGAGLSGAFKGASQTPFGVATPDPTGGAKDLGDGGGMGTSSSEGAPVSLSADGAGAGGEPGSLLAGTPLIIAAGLAVGALVLLSKRRA